MSEIFERKGLSALQSDTRWNFNLDTGFIGVEDTPLGWRIEVPGLPKKLELNRTPNGAVLSLKYGGLSLHTFVENPEELIRSLQH